MKLKKSYYGWAAFISVYLIFITALSWLYPYGLDEYITYQFSLSETVDRAIFMFWLHSPKMGVFLGAIFIFVGKWLFVLFNPFVQLAIVLAMFYFVRLRLPDFNNYKDFSLFALLALAGLFFGASTPSTVFWLCGSVNYSWPFLAIIFYLCMLRAFYEGKPLFKDSWRNAFLVLLLGIWLGLSNENNAPAMLLVTGCFGAWCFYKGKKLPKWFYFAAFGIAAGVAYMFLSPALYARRDLNSPYMLDFSIWQKLFFHISHIHTFVVNNMVLPFVNFLLLLILALERDRRAFKYSAYMMALFCFAMSCMAAFVLFMAPKVDGRVYYSASMFSILSFVFILDYMRPAYGLNLIKYAAIAMIAFSILFAPLFTLPFVSLYRQDARRAAVLKSAIDAGKKEIILPYYVVPSAPLRNLNIIYFDVLGATPEELQKYLGITVIPAMPFEPDAYDEDGVFLF